VGKYGKNKRNVRLKKKWLKRRRKEVKNTIDYMLAEAEISGLIPWAPVKIEYDKLDQYRGTAELKIDSDGKEYFLITLEIDLLDGSAHGENLACLIFCHELAHVLTWHPNKKTERGLAKYHGIHGPDFMYMQGTLLNILIEP